MNLTRRQKRLGILGAAGLAGATALVISIPAFAGGNDKGDGGGGSDETVTLELKDAHTNSEAVDFNKDCDGQIPDDKPADYDGWVFVLPNPAGDEFISVTAVFEDEEGGEHTEQAEVVSNGNSGSAKHAYVGVPSGWILVDASAEVKNGDEGETFNVTHTCPGEAEEESTTDAPTSDAPTSDEPTSEAPTSDAPTSDEPTSDAPTSDEPTSDAPTSDEPTSDAPTSDAPTTEPEASTSPAESSPAESSPAESSPAESSSAAPSSEAPSSAAPSSSTPVQVSTSPAGNALPTTGSSLTYFLVGAGVLLAAGIVLLVLMRRRAEDAEGA